MLQGAEFVSGVGAAYVDLEGGHADQSVVVVEEVVKDIVDGRLGEDQFLWEEKTFS